MLSGPGSTFQYHASELSRLHQNSGMLAGYETVFLLSSGLTGSSVARILAVRGCLHVLWPLYYFLRLSVRIAASWAHSERPAPYAPQFLPRNYKAKQNTPRSNRVRYLISGPRAVGERSQSFGGLGLPPAGAVPPGVGRAAAAPRSAVPQPGSAPPSAGPSTAAPPPGPLSCRWRAAPRAAFGVSFSGGPSLRGPHPRAGPPSHGTAAGAGRVEPPGTGRGGAGRRRRERGPPPAPHDAAPPSCRPAEKRELGAEQRKRPAPAPAPAPAPPFSSARGRAGSAAGHGRAADAAAAGLRADRRPRLQLGRRAAGRVFGRRGQLFRLRRGLLRSRSLLVSVRSLGLTVSERVWSASSRSSAARQPSRLRSPVSRHLRYLNPAARVIKSKYVLFAFLPLF